MDKKHKQKHSLFSDIRESHWYPSSRPFRIGLFITVVWLASGIFYVSNGVGWSGFLDQPIDVIGNFFEGAFAPLLFLWIVIGFFLQQKAISDNAKSIVKQAQQTQLNTFLRLSKLVLQQLGVISGHIYITTQGPQASGRETEESASMLWMKFHGDERVFVRKLLEYGSAAEDPGRLNPDIYFGNEAVTRHTENYIRTFEKLITDAETCDPDYVLRDALLTGTGQGILYRTIMDVRSMLEMREIEREQQKDNPGMQDDKKIRSVS